MKNYFIAVLFLCWITSFSQPFMLSESLSDYCPNFVLTDSGRVVFVDDEGVLRSVSIEAPEDSRELEVDWEGLLDEWGTLGRAWNVCGNSDGTMICFTMFVAVPDTCAPESAGRIPSPLIVVACGSDGKDPRLLGITFDIGYPHFHFTQDSRYIFSTSWYQCSATPQAWVEYVTGNQSERLDLWLMVSLEDGNRSGEPDLEMGAFMVNPYSDLAATGRERVHQIVDIVTGEVLLENSVTEDPPIIDRWVLPNAGLARDQQGDQILRFTDGLEYVNIGDPLEVYCMLRDGRHLFTLDGGNTVLVGEINWSDFSFPEAVVVSGLEDLEPRYTRVVSTTDGEGIVFSNRGRLFHMDFQEP